MSPNRETVSPFRGVSPTQSARKAGKKHPYAFATPPRTHKGGAGSPGAAAESPRFGKAKSMFIDKKPQVDFTGKPGDTESESSGGIQIATVVDPKDPFRPKKQKAHLEKADLSKQKTGGYLLSTRGSNVSGQMFATH
jgi:hypothetical protein